MKLLAVFSQYSAGYLESLAASHSLRAIREGLLWIIPCLLVSATFLVASVIFQALQMPPVLIETTLSLHAEISRILPLLIASSIGYMMSIHHRLPRLPVAFLCFSYVAIAASLLQDHPRAAASFILFIAIASPLLNVPIMAWLHRQKWTQIARVDMVGDNVRDSLNLIIPGTLTAILLAVCLHLLLLSPLIAWLDAPLQLPFVDSPYWSGILVAGLNSLLWFFGIHGYHALQPVFDVLDQAVALNAIDVLSGGGGAWVLNSSLLGAFTFIGGSGGTFSLLLAILIFCRHRSLRLLALASLPIALLNVNEILLFGLPIILNPRLALPFFCVPMINVTLALAAAKAGLIDPVVASLPLNSPVLLNAYLATGGDYSALLLQLGLLGLGVLVYAPFIRAIDVGGRAASTIKVRSLDTTFTQLHEEASLYANDPVVFANSFRKMQREQSDRIRDISEYEFYLEYQPQVALGSGLCTGCESLLRARDQEGRTQQPWEFLQWLEQAGLMRDLDIWVASEAIRQVERWRGEGFALPVTINVTGHTLVDPVYCDKLVRIVARARGLVSIEITEQALAGDVGRVQAAIDEFHRVGARVYIDDFGTGYSSLSYLHQFAIDVIKIDRSFVLALDSERGRETMAGLLRFAETLGLGVVIEGVESESQLQAFAGHDELVIQGWYFCKALAADRLAEYVRARQALVSSA
jgi:lactose/cellobiose-specific phosphotransferase system IIC component